MLRNLPDWKLINNAGFARIDLVYSEGDLPQLR